LLVKSIVNNHNIAAEAVLQLTHENLMNTRISCIAVVLFLIVVPSSLVAQGTAFTYQGQLQNNGAPASGTYNLQFTLYTNGSGGTSVAGPVTDGAVVITNGLFTVTMDFGKSPWNGATNWLQIDVETNGGGSFTPLSPRPQLTPTPYAIFAELTGASTNFSGSLAGDVTGTQSATVVSAVGGQSAVNVASGVIAANAATNSDIPNTVVKRDASGTFVTESIALDNEELRANGSGAYNLRDFLLRADNSKGNLYVGDNPPRATLAAGTGNTGVGSGAAFNDTTGSGNTAVGSGALDSTMGANGNTAIGTSALQANVIGHANTANGYQALYSDTTDYNTADGYQALYSDTSGYANVANGFQALYSNQGGVYNTVNGAGAMQYNTNGNDNVADGYEALFFNTSGNWNTASGFGALYNNTTASGNVANGFEACFSNTGGTNNVAIGYEALYSNVNGADNTASGYQALYSNIGYFNTADGEEALKANTTGADNTATGHHALESNTTGGNNTAVGYSALLGNTTGNNNIGIGYGAGSSITTGSGNIEIGSSGSADTNVIRIGGSQTQTFIAGISGVTISPSGAAVFINSQGQLGTVNSSRRYKEGIVDMGSQSDVLLSLRPVSFRYKHDLDPAGTPQYGLIAEEVEKVAPELVLRDTRGQIYSVRYEQINAMLLNEFLKEHQTVESQKAEIDDLKGRLEALEQTVKSIAQKN
jgi:hypothetical protein